MTREEQIKFMETSQDRVRTHVAAWVRDPQFRASLHRDLPPEQPADPGEFSSVEKRKFG